MVISMDNYKEMYLTLMRATEQAIRILIEAQQRCEEMYLSTPETAIRDLENTLTQIQELDIV